MMGGVLTSAAAAGAVGEIQGRFGQSEGKKEEDRTQRKRFLLCEGVRRSPWRCFPRVLSVAVLRSFPPFLPWPDTDGRGNERAVTPAPTPGLLPQLHP